MGPLPYTVQNSLLDAAFPKGALNYWKAQFLTDLSDDCIKTLIECAVACPSPMSQIVLEHFHGKASRVGVAETACAMRLNGFNVVIVSQWQDPSETRAWHQLVPGHLRRAAALFRRDALRELSRRRRVG
jgi:hypothetical protein